jgi:hypothetical protein
MRRITNHLIGAGEIQIRSTQWTKKTVPLHPIVGRHDLPSVTSLRESPSFADHFDFTERCRQMLEPVMPAPMLNPMHPPRARQLMALSIRTLGDAPLGWRYPSVLEQVRLIQVMPAMKIRDILDKP